jgi:hypothetical protein
MRSGSNGECDGGISSGTDQGQRRPGTSSKGRREYLGRQGGADRRWGGGSDGGLVDWRAWLSQFPLVVGSQVGDCIIEAALEAGRNEPRQSF